MAQGVKSSPKIGRPTALTPAVIKKIAECFFDGLNDSETALLCHIDVRTIQRARAGTFCREIKKAEAAQLQHYLRLIRDGKQRDWVRIAWFLERRYPERFARPEIQLSFNNSYTQNNLNISIGAQEAKAIESAANPIRQKVLEMFKTYRPHDGNGNGEK